jgi:hypothetical protein
MKKRTVASDVVDRGADATFSVGGEWGVSKADAVRFFLARVEMTAPVRAEAGESIGGEGGRVHLLYDPIKLELGHGLGVGKGGSGGGGSVGGDSLVLKPPRNGLGLERNEGCFEGVEF